MIRFFATQKISDNNLATKALFVNQSANRSTVITQYHTEYICIKNLNFTNFFQYKNGLHLLIHAYTKKSGRKTGKSHLCALADSVNFMEQMIRTRDITPGIANDKDLLQNLRPLNLARYCLLPSELINLFHDYSTALEGTILFFFCKLTTKYK